MVLLLNLVSWVVVLIFIYIWYKTKKFRYLVVAAVFMLIYNIAQPSYMPKGTVTRMANPAFEQSNAAIEDRNRKPEDPNERQARQEQSYRDGFPK